jgi:P-type conjugative transfer protein TrbL
MRRIWVIAILSVLLAGHGLAQTKITAYGYSGDLTSDSNSSAGIGNHDNVLSRYQGGTGVSDAALTPSAAQQYGVTLGQTFTATGANGVTYTLRYEDSAPQYYQGQNLGNRIDIYDPNQVLTGGSDNSFSTTAVAVNGNPAPTADATISGISTTGVATGANQTVQDVAIPVVNPMLQKFQAVAQSWTQPLMTGVTRLFWILAGISALWTGIWMALRRAELIEIAAELVRFILVTGFFYWLLINGPYFAQAIIGSLRTLGGEASGTGQAVYPAQLVNLGVSVLQAQMKLVNWLFPAAAFIPISLCLIILVMTILIAANIVVLLISAWIVIFAGIVVLGFGGCRWTSDMAVNYFRTALGVGLSLFVLELILGIGTSFLQSLVQQGQSGDLGQVVALTIAVILLAILAHKLPALVSGMVTGAGHHHGMGALGLAAAIGAALAAAGMARTIGSGAAAAAGVGAAQNRVKDRIAASEAAIAGRNARNGQGNT